MAGTPLTGSTPSTTYDALLKITDNAGVTGSLKTVTDGLGVDSALQVSSAGVKSTGTLDVTGAVTLATPLPITGGGTGSATASAARTALGLGDVSTQTASSVAITGGSIAGITDLAVADGGTGASTAANARTNLGVTATGSDTTYVFRSNNLSDLGSASTSRTNLGVTATGADTTYNSRANNLSDVASASTSRTNLGLGSIATQSASAVAITGGTAALTSLTTSGSVTAGTGFGCNGKSAQTAYDSGYAYPLNPYGSGTFGFDTENKAFQLYDMVEQIRAALIANGIMSQ